MKQNTYIKKAILKGYKSIQDVEVSFQQGLNILIGANGGGKTNFMLFLNAVCNESFDILINGRKIEAQIEGDNFSLSVNGQRLMNNVVSLPIFSFERVKNFQQKKTVKKWVFTEERKLMSVTSDETEPELTNSALYLSFDNPLLRVFEEKLTLNLAIQSQNSAFDAPVENLRTWIKTIENPTFLNRLFSAQIEYQNEEPKSLASAMKNIENQFDLSGLIANLAQFSIIKNLKIDWALTRRTIFKDENEKSGQIEGIDFQFFVNDQWLNWTQLSEGTKRLFYLIGSLTFSPKEEILLIEEPETGIHPHQLSLLMNFIEEMAESKQVILSTHAPQILNCLKENQLDAIIITRHEGKSGTKMYHLSDDEKNYATEYMKNEAFLSDYWLQSGFLNEEPSEIV